jgi:menaquinone-dependent protoporphyrinogen oxidase
MKDSRVHVVIVVASRHGATLGIAGALSQRLVENDLRVTVTNPADCPDLADADVLVIGSAVYVGKWLKPALKFIEGHQAELRSRPVWLFSSGPLDDEEGSSDGMDEDYIAHLTEHAHARAHHVFSGRLDRASLGPMETFVAYAAHAPSGDFRDWDDVAGWADEVAEAISGAHLHGVDG